MIKMLTERGLNGEIDLSAFIPKPWLQTSSLLNHNALLCHFHLVMVDEDALLKSLNVLL